MFISSTLRTLIEFHKNEQRLLVQERKNISFFCSQVFAIISLIMTIIFGVMMFFALPFFRIRSKILITMQKRIIRNIVLRKEMS